MTVHLIDLALDPRHHTPWPASPRRRPRSSAPVTQRGNGRVRTFFGDDDYALYRDLLAEHCRRRCRRVGLASSPDGAIAKSGATLASHVPTAERTTLLGQLV